MITLPLLELTVVAHSRGQITQKSFPEMAATQMVVKHAVKIKTFV